MRIRFTTVVWVARNLIRFQKCLLNLCQTSAPARLVRKRSYFSRPVQRDCGPQAQYPICTYLNIASSFRIDYYLQWIPILHLLKKHFAFGAAKLGRPRRIKQDDPQPVHEKNGTQYEFVDALNP